MVPYIVLGLLLLIGLVAAYRMLGGSSTAEVDAGQVMGLARDALLTISAELAAWTHDRVAGTPNKLRRRVEAQTQLLERIDPPHLDDADAAAHALLGVAADELGWAARICSAAGFDGSEGLQQAAGVLVDHARSCLAEVTTSAPAAASGLAEERHRLA